MASRELVFLRLGAARRLTRALHCLTRGAKPLLRGGVTGLLVTAASDEDVPAHFSQETAPLLVLEDAVEVFLSLSVGGTPLPPRLLSRCGPGTLGALLVCGVCWQGRVSRVFMVVTQRVAEVHPSDVVRSILTPEKAVSVRPGNGDALPVSVMSLSVSSIFKEALRWNNKLNAAQTHVCPPVPCAELCLTAEDVKSCDFLGLPAPERFVASMARAAQRRSTRPVREVVEARVTSLVDMPPESSSPSVQTKAPKTMALHSSTRRWRPCLMVLAAGLLLALCLIWEANNSQGIVKWLASRLGQCWCLVATTVSTCRRVLVSTLRRLCYGLLLLARASSRCCTRLLQTDLLLIALALQCCSLLHFALSAALLCVMPVRHALRRLEHQLSACPRPVLTVATLLWRGLVTVMITCVFAAVAAHAW